jgi:hypothetical protein
MSINTHILGDTAWRSHPMRPRVEAVVQSASGRLSKEFGVTDVTLVVFPTPNLTDPRWPVSGMCHNANAVECCFNPDHPGFASKIEAELPRAIVHEVHHALRYRFAGPWTVGENLVLEGLALCAEEQFGIPSQPFETLPQDVSAQLLARAQRDHAVPINPDGDSSRFNWIWEHHSAKHVSNMYYIGKALVAPALATTGLSAFAALDRPYQWFFEMSRTH